MDTITILSEPGDTQNFTTTLGGVGDSSVTTEDIQDFSMDTEYVHDSAEVEGDDQDFAKTTDKVYGNIYDLWSQKKFMILLRP